MRTIDFSPFRILLAVYFLFSCLSVNASEKCFAAHSRFYADPPLMVTGKLTIEPETFGYPNEWSYYHVGGGSFYSPFFGAGGARSTTYRAVNSENNERRMLKRYYKSENLESDLFVMNFLSELAKTSDVGFLIPDVTRSTIDSLTVETIDVRGIDLRFFPTEEAGFKINKAKLFERYNDNVLKLYKALVSAGLGQNFQLSYSGYYRTWYGMRRQILTIDGEIAIPINDGIHKFKISIRDDNVIVNPKYSKTNKKLNDLSDFTFTLIDPE